jgi:hypothetical protein
MDGAASVAAFAMGYLEKIDAVAKMKRGASAVGAKVSSWTDAALKPIKDQLAKIPKAIEEKLKERYGAFLGGVDFIGESLAFIGSKLLDAVTGRIPGWSLVSDAGAALAAVIKASQGAWDAIKQAYFGWNVTLLGGHPSIISKALARHSAAEVAGGLGSATYSSAKIAGTVTTTGMSDLVVLIIDIFLAVFAFVDRLVQRFFLKKFFNKCRAEWALRHQGSWLATDHDKFSKWFRKNVVLTPALAPITLLSGICAHPLKFLQLLGSSGDVASQSSFDAGVKYIDELKVIGSRFLRSYLDAFNFTLSSSDNFVAARVREMTTGQGLIHHLNENGVYTLA